MNSLNKKIYSEIKKINTIYIARHIGPDPDAICSSFALRESIKLTFPDKEVYAIGASVAKFKSFGPMDKITSLDKNALVICLDVPDKKRIDGLNIEEYKNVIKIDHHPFIEKYGEIELINDQVGSASELVLDLINETKLKINTNIAGNLFLGMVADSNRFLFHPTDAKLLRKVADLIEKNKLNIQKLYTKLYERPISDVRLMGYIAENLKVTKNGFAYIELDEDIINSFNADISSASNMINDFNNISEVYVWVFVTNDPTNKNYRINIRSRGPIVNEIAMKYGGGGHKFASGVRTTDKEIIPKLLDELDKLCKEYKNKTVN